MKLVGLVAVLIAAGAAGFYAGDKYLSVLKGIKRTDRLISQIILGLQSEHQTLGEIFENASENGDLSTKNFLQNISVSNLAEGAKIAKKCDFCRDKTAIAILSEAFGILGKYSAEQQIEELNFCRNKLRALYENSEEQILAKAKLSRCFGILAGAFIFIMLI